MKLVKPFIQLPYRFDVERLQIELESLANRQWLPHPSGMAGNEALPLVSRGAEDNDDFDGAMDATRHLVDSPYIRQCMHHIGEVYGRSRLMSLAPGAEVSRHVDFNYHWYSRVRIHIPIVTSPDVIFHCGDQAINMKAGSCWIFDSWRHHRVVNSGAMLRTHLVLDTAGSSKFWNAVQSSVAGTVDVPDIPLPYDTGADCAITTERYNSSPVMAPGEMQALVGDLINDLRNNASNSEDMLDTFENTLTNLVHDWRALWTQHGFSSSGVPHYQRLLQNTVACLPDTPRALTTASNDIGANPVVMQRIIRAALRPDLSNSFKI